MDSCSSSVAPCTAGFGSPAAYETICWCIPLQQQFSLFKMFLQLSPSQKGQLSCVKAVCSSCSCCVACSSRDMLHWLLSKVPVLPFLQFVPAPAGRTKYSGMSTCALLLQLVHSRGTQACFTANKIFWSRPSLWQRLLLVLSHNS